MAMGASYSRVRRDKPLLVFLVFVCCVKKTFTTEVMVVVTMKRKVRRRLRL